MTGAVNTFLASIPSPDRGVWYIGPVPLRAYALCIIVGIVVAIWWSERRYVARGGEKGVITDVAVFAVPFGLVGGRLYHVATDWPKYFGPGGDPIGALKIWEGGLGIWGAVALGAVGAWLACRRRGIPLAVVADVVAPGLIVAQAIGRLGNWFNQELYGGATDLPWGLEIYRRIDPETGLDAPITGVATDHTPLMTVHPTFLYELLWNVGVALLIVWADRRFRLGHGRVFALYVAGYTAGRFWIELMRTDPATLIAGIRINVFTSVLVFAGAVLYLLLVRGGREDPAVLQPKDADDPDAGDPNADATAGSTSDEGDADPDSAKNEPAEVSVSAGPPAGPASTAASAQAAPATASTSAPASGSAASGAPATGSTSAPASGAAASGAASTSAPADPISATADPAPSADALPADPTAPAKPTADQPKPATDQAKPTTPDAP